MTHHTLPEVDQLVPIDKVTPSSLEAFRQCPFSQVLKNTIREPMLPSFPQARVGKTAHKLIEMALRGRIPDLDSVAATWDILVKQEEASMMKSPLESHIPPLEQAVRDYEVRKKRALLQAERVMKLPSEGQSLGNAATGAEKEVSARNGRIFGKIDHVQRTERGIVLRDYKTGSIGDTDGDIAENFKVQLKLYCAVYAEDTGQWPVSLELVGPSGSTFEVGFTQDECEEGMSEALALIEKTRKIIEDLSVEEASEELANPSPENCRFCEFRPACSSYKSISTLESWDSRQDVWGTLRRRQKLHNGKMLIELIDENCNASATIRGLSQNENRHPSLDCARIGVHIEAYNLTGRLNDYRETSLTTIYGRELSNSKVNHPGTNVGARSSPT